tara:strand:+ start:2913 stop:3227 length:315 start_codon:yes stop_codon:yes gene_type:complete
MDELKHTIHELDHEISNVMINYNKLKNNLNKNEKLVEKISHVMDIKEIVSILNERILYINDNIEIENLDISKYAIDRIENNKIVKKVLQPYIPYILANLCKYNT